MPDLVEQALSASLSDPCYIGEIVIRKRAGGGFALCHREDDGHEGLRNCQRADGAIEIAKFDDAGKYRPLKTAPNLRHGWRMEVVDLGELRFALDYFYPARLAALASRKEATLKTTPLRDTLRRQSGMYRVAANITDEQIEEVVSTFCKSDGGCLRAILWKRDTKGALPSTKLPPEKWDPAHDQAGSSPKTIPLLCQEACNLLVNECRKAVKCE